MKRTSILQCPGMVCSPPVVSKCLGEAHRRLELFTLFTLDYLDYLDYIRSFFFFSILLVIIYLFFLQGQPTNSMGSEHLKTTRSCMDTPMNMYSSKVHIKR